MISKIDDNARELRGKFEKPPLGVMAEWRHLEIRKQQLEAAIGRYKNSSHKPNPDWRREVKRIDARLRKLVDQGKYTGRVC